MFDAEKISAELRPRSGIATMPKLDLPFGFFGRGPENINGRLHYEIGAWHGEKKYTARFVVDPYSYGAKEIADIVDLQTECKVAEILWRADPDGVNQIVLSEYENDPHLRSVVAAEIVPIISDCIARIACPSPTDAANKILDAIREYVGKKKRA